MNPHVSFHYRVTLRKAGKDEGTDESDVSAITYTRAIKHLPPETDEIKPHPHGVELGILMQMLKSTEARTLRSALSHDFSRVSDRAALEICERAGLNPKARPTSIAHRESEALYNAIQDTKLMRPPTDCLAPIGEAEIEAGLRKEIEADFYTTLTRAPTIYRGNPFLIEIGMAYAKPKADDDLNQESPVRVLRFANRVPLLYMAGACSITRAVTGVNWKAYGLGQPRGSLPVGPLVMMVHIASVWVPFTSESKDAVANYPEIIQEITLGLQECGRRLSTYLSRKQRAAEAERKRNYIEMYIPHLARGLKDILVLNEKAEDKVVTDLKGMLERTHLDV